MYGDGRFLCSISPLTVCVLSSPFLHHIGHSKDRVEYDPLLAPANLVPPREGPPNPRTI